MNARNNNKETALLLSAFKGHLKMVKLLVSKGANINAREKGGWSALSVALKKKHKAIAKFLKSKGARK